MADEFGSVGTKQLEQTKSIFVTPVSKTMNKGLRDGADVLDERVTQQCRSLFGTALNVGQDRPETQYTTEESARFMPDSTRAVKYICSNACVSITARHPYSAGVFHIKKCSVRSER